MGTLERNQLEKDKKKLPDSLTVTINAKHCENMKGAQLDINESTLVFSVEGLYYLDLNLKYKCNTEEGSAKFDKTKKTLTIKLPVIGLTEDSQKVADQHWAEFIEMEKKREEEYKNLEMSTLQEDADKARFDRSHPKKGGADKENDEPENDENAGDAKNLQPENEDGDDGILNEGVAGVSQRKFLMSVDNDKEAADSKIDDKYSESADSRSTRIAPSDDDGEDKRDAMTRKREDFLNIYQENKDGDGEGNDEPDLSNGIKFKRDAEDEDSGFEMKTGNEGSGKKPLIQELDVKQTEEIAKQKQAREAAAAYEEAKEFDFETAERTELKGNFI